MKKWTKTFAAAALILSAGTVSAQDNKTDNFLESVKPSTPKVSGLVNGRYSYDSSDDSNGFDIRRARLAVSGDFGSKLDYKVQAEYGGGKANSAATVKLLDAYLRIKLSKEINFQIGEFKVAYSQETLDGPTSWLTIENPTVVNKLNGYSDESGLSANSRDVGARIYGSFIHKQGFDVISYKLGVYNGNGINLKDNNTQKDVAGLLYVTPVKSLTLSVGHYIGHYGETGKTVRRDRTSAGFTFKENNLFLRSEYLHGKTGDRSHQGVYATAGYKLAYGLQPVLSYGYYQKDTDSKRDNQSDYQIGLNWQANKYIRTQLGYTFTKYTNSEKKNKNLIETQLLVAF